MNKFSKKVLALTISLCLLIIVCVPVAALESSDNHFTLYVPNMTIPIDVNGLVPETIEKKTGVIFDNIIIGNGSDVTQQINLKIAGGSLGADSISLDSGNANWARLVKEKKILPLDKYFKDSKNYPNLAKIDKRIIDYYTQSDGHIYFVPCGFETVVDQPSEWNSNPQGLWLRNDLIAKLGMKKSDLTTLSGFETYMKKVKGLKDENGKDIIPLSIAGENFDPSSFNVLLAMFGVPAYEKSSWVEQSNGKVIPGYQTAGFKQAFQWINKQYRAGLIDVETPYQKKDLYLQKANSMRYGGMFVGWDASTIDYQSFKAAGLKDSTTYAELKASGKLSTIKWLEPIPLPKVPGVAKIAQYSFFNPFGGVGTGITAECKNPDLLMKCLDWMISNEAQPILFYGPPEFGAAKMENGVLVQDAAFINGPKMWGGIWKTVTDVGFWWFANVAMNSGDHIPMLEAPWPAQNAMMYKAETISHQQGSFGLMPKFARVKTLIGGKVEKYTPVQTDITLKYYAKLLMAKTDKDFQNTYNSYLSEMKGRGHDAETIAEFNKQYSDYSKTPAGKINIKITKYMTRNVWSDKAIVVQK